MRFSNFADFYRWLKQNKAAMFVHGVLFNWYTMIMVPTVYAGYHFLKGLEKIGVLQRMEQHTREYLESIVKISEQCTPLILDIHALFDCLSRY